MIMLAVKYMLIKGRVQSQMVFFLVLYLKTSFLVYICILGQIKRKKNFLDFFDFFGGHFGKKHVKYARARALTYVTRLIFFRLLSFSVWWIIIILSRMHFFIFLIDWKLSIYGYILKWRDSFSLFLTFIDFQRHLKKPI